MAVDGDDLPRVVILGGGMGGLATAWELTQGDWRSRLGGVTVYQRGWRLGGKGASSRGIHGRIEEHGLHVLLGYYDATFRVLRECYGELDRMRTDPSCPIRTWDEALRPSGDIGLAEPAEDGWRHFVTRFATNDALPGEPGAEDRSLDPFEVARRSIGLLLDFHGDTEAAGSDGEVYLSARPDPSPRSSGLAAATRAAGLTALAVVLEVAQRSVEVAGMVTSDRQVDTLDGLLGAVRDGLHRAVAADEPARRTWHLIDLVATNLRGMVVDGLLGAASFAAIDHLDYRQWLRSHGAAADTLESPIVRGMYDLVFGYEDGDRQRPAFSAGVGLGLAARMLFDFKGGIFWRMQAGMGEVVFAPLYQALAARGVEFHFFHRLDEIRPDGDGGAVGEIVLGRQAEPLAGTAGYDPLMRVGGLPCWPSGPDPTQLTAAPAIDLESHPAARADTGRTVLRAGEDFEVAVLAVPPAMIAHVCPAMVAGNERWAAMVGNVATVATQSFQLWLDADHRRLGWHGPAGVTLSGFADPFDTWAAMPPSPSPGGMGWDRPTPEPGLLLRGDGRANRHRGR